MSIRQILRQARRSISEASRTVWNQQINHQLSQHPEILKASSVACYFPIDGEVDLTAFIRQCHQAKLTCVLPALNPSSTLEFAVYDEQTPLVKNRFGIFEPDLTQAKRISPNDLGVVLMPMVGFSESGHRLGMGGGYYDRTFAFRLKSKAPPTLIGVAFECQKSESFPVHPWDVPCDYIVTEKTSYSP